MRIYNAKTRILSTILVCIAFACNQIDSKGKVPEMRMGSSDYYIALPANYTLSEARGKEGQLGYNIQPTDPKSTMFGFVEIFKDKPVVTLPPEMDSAKIYKNATLDGKHVEWKLYHGASGYYTAFTVEKSELNARASSKELTDIDSLISIISTVRKK